MGLNEKHRCRTLAAFVAIFPGLWGGSVALAEDFFTLTATPAGGTTVSANGGNLRNLMDDMIHAQGAFTSLAGNAYTANLTYGNRNSAFVMNGSADGKTLTLSIPTSGFSKTFVAGTRQ